MCASAAASPIDPTELAHVRKTRALAGAAPVPDALQPNASDPIMPARVNRPIPHSPQAGRGEQAHAPQDPTIAVPIAVEGGGYGHCRFPAATVVKVLDAPRMHRGGGCAAIAARRTPLVSAGRR